MKQIIALALLAAGVLGTASCGSDHAVSPTPSASGNQPTTQAPATTKAPISDPGTLPVPYTKLATKTGPVTGDPVPWTLVRTDPAQNRIYIAATQVGCAAPDAVYLQETPSEVTITVTSPPQMASGPCTQQNVTLVGYVQLNDPLGNRHVVGNG